MLYDRGTGWCDWELPNFKDRISYINDFPYNVMEALIAYFETGEEQSVNFDAEGWCYTFKFSSNVTVGDTVLYESVEGFAMDFVDELEKNLESWAHFPARRTADGDYDELAGYVVKVRMMLIDDESLEKWIEIISR